MTDRVKLAVAANILTKEALAFFWALEFCQAKGRAPSIRSVCSGVFAEYGEALTLPTAARGLRKARAQAQKNII